VSVNRHLRAQESVTRSQMQESLGVPQLQRANSHCDALEKMVGEVTTYFLDFSHMRPYVSSGVSGNSASAYQWRLGEAVTKVDHLKIHPLEHTWKYEKWSSRKRRLMPHVPLAFFVRTLTISCLSSAFNLSIIELTTDLI
jgi:hypothetical protein